MRPQAVARLSPQSIMGKKNKNQFPPGYPPHGMPPPGYPPHGHPPHGAPPHGFPPPGYGPPPPGAGFPPPYGYPPGYEPPPPPPPLPPDQLEELALNAEIEANENKVKRLKRIRGPCSFTGCLLNILIFVALGLGLTFLIIFLVVDRFDILALIRDIIAQLRFAELFARIEQFFRDLFSGELFRSGEESTIQLVRSFFIR